MVDHLTPDNILNDPTASRWLKAALAGALALDPVDAANQAAVLAEVLDTHSMKALEEARARVDLNKRVSTVTPCRGIGGAVIDQRLSNDGEDLAAAGAGNNFELFGDHCISGL